MSFGVVHKFAGGTKEQYEASVAAVHPADGSLPKGQTFHAAGPSDSGWTIVAIHDSKETWESFSRRHLDAKDDTGHRRWLYVATRRDNL